MRLIDADALCTYANNNKEKTIDANDIMRFPIVDAVPVVRCKDCLYWAEHEERSVRGTCKVLNFGDIPLGTHYNDYCWFAEARCVKIVGGFGQEPFKEEDTK